MVNMIINPSQKLRIAPKTLDDKIIKDGLCAISLLNEKEPYYLVGGIAVQSYLPTSCRRPTSDIDSSIARPLNNKTDFDNMVKKVLEYLNDLGYSTETKKHSGYFGIQLTDKKREALMIEFARRNRDCFNRNKKKLEREYENSRNKIIEERKVIYKTATPEDLSVPKIARSINALKRNKELLEYVPQTIESYSDKEVINQLEKINQLRGEAMFSLSNPELAERLRFTSDIYDVRILSEITGFNKAYWETACRDWDTLTKESSEKRKLVKVLTPLYK